MVFNTIEFWLFFAVVFVCVHLLQHRWQNYFLLAASLWFYAAWDWRFLCLLLAVTLVNYVSARFVSAEYSKRTRNIALAIGLGASLITLGLFKYYDFFVDSFMRLTGITPDPRNFPLLHLILPMGISFYTFQAISYLVDVYAGRLEPLKRISDFALYKTFFPQLVAGPIERATHLIPQIVNPRKFDPAQIEPAVFLIVWGMFKKVVIADTLAHTVGLVYGYDAPTGAEVYVATFLFAIQIYCDFSGYTDIARGVAKLLGFELMLNFNLPYIAKNPSDFWRRWHISLSTWLRDYVYIPLGGNKHGTVQTYRNLMITMVLGGLWHGARFNFALWGFYHGLLLSVHRMTQSKAPKPDTALTSCLKIIGMFQLTLFGWLLFRVETPESLATLTHALATGWGNLGSAPAMLAEALPYILPLVAVQIWQVLGKDLMPFVRTAWPVKAALVGVFLGGVLMFDQSSENLFIYFQF